MSGTFDGLPDADRSFEQRPRAHVVTRGLEEHAEIVRALGHLAVQGTKNLLADSERFSGFGNAFSRVTNANVLYDLRVQLIGPLQLVLLHLSRVAECAGGRHHPQPEPDGNRRAPPSHRSGNDWVKPSRLHRPPVRLIPNVTGSRQGHYGATLGFTD